MKVKPDCDDCGGLCSIAGGFILKTAHCSLIQGATNRESIVA